MKTIQQLLLVAAIAIGAASCGGVDFKKTDSGLLYKIISSGKDSVVKQGEWLKFNYVQKVNDSILQTTFGKMPVYQKIAPTPGMVYNPAEVFPLLRKGDSVVTVMLIDSILKKGLAREADLPPFMKKGDKITVSFKVIDVFKSDSAYQVDAKGEYDRDRPRQEKEQQEQMAKMREEMIQQRAKEEAELTKSGEIGKELAAMESYLAKNKITAQKIDKGIWVTVTEMGTGPKVDSGKYCTVHYVGKMIDKDTTFQTGDFSRQVDVGQLIYGMDKGLKLINEGGKATIYVPGFLAYGTNPPPGSGFKPYEPLKFEVEVKKVSDTPLADQPASPQQ